MKNSPSAVRGTFSRVVVDRWDAEAAGIEPGQIKALDDAIALDAVAALPRGDRLRQVADVLHRYGLIRKADAWVETTLTPDWVAALRLTLQRGTLIVSEVRVFPNEPNRKHLGQWSAEWKGSAAAVPKGGLRMRTLRKLSWGPSVQWAQQLAVQFRKKAPPEMFAALFGEEDIRAPKATRPARGRPPLPDEFVATVAKAYVEVLKPGSRPNKVIAERFEIAPGRVAGIIFQARQRGFLSPARAQGQAGGSLTRLGAQVAARALRRRTKRKQGRKSTRSTCRRRAFAQR